MRYFILIYSLVSVSLISGQSIIITEGFTSAFINNEAYVHEDSLGEKSIDDVIHLPDDQWSLLPPKGLTTSHSSHAYWIRFALEANQSTSCFIEMDYALNDEVTLYEVTSEATRSLGETGDVFPSSGRLYKYRNPLYHIELTKGALVHYYLRVKKKRSVVYAPLILYEEHAFLDSQAHKELMNGILLGSFILFLTFSIITAITLRSRVYAFFSLHVFAFMIYILSSSGIGYIYIWSNYLLLTNYLGYLCAFFSIIALTLLYRHYFHLSEKYPSQDKTISWLLRYYFSVAVLAMVGYTAFPYQLFINLIKVTHYSLLVLPLILMVLGIQYYRKFKNGDALFFLLAFSISLSGFLIVPLRPIIQLSPESYILFRYLLSLECLLLFVMLFKDLYDSKNEQISLQKKLIVQKKQFIDSFLSGQLKERKRISMNLHDSVGIKLANLKLRLSNGDHPLNGQEVLESIDHLSDEIRHISHELNPIALERNGLVTAMENDIFRIEAVNDQITIEFNYSEEMIAQKGKELDHIYWVFLELVNNVLKHSRATEILINLYRKGAAIYLSVRDNGIGYDHAQSNDHGIGLYNIYNRANLIDGRFKITRMEDGMEHLFMAPVD